MPRSDETQTNCVDCASSAVKAERDYTDGQIASLRERLDAMDKASLVLNETVTRVPTEVQREVGNLRSLMNEKFKLIDIQFNERDKRSEREWRDSKTAIDAALAAQKEAATEQNKSNNTAISKSDDAQKEKNDRLEQLFKSTTDALAARVDELKTRFERTEGQGAGLKMGYGWILGAIGAVAAIIAILAR